MTCVLSSAFCLQSNVVLLLDTNNGTIRRLLFSPEAEEAPKRMSWWGNKEELVRKSIFLVDYAQLAMLSKHDSRIFSVIASLDPPTDIHHFILILSFVQT